MHRLGRLIAAAVLLAGALGAVGAATIATGAQAASAAGTGCTGYSVGGNSWAIECTNGATYGTGSGGTSNPDVCQYITLADAESQFLVSAAVVADYHAPKGFVYLFQDCPDQFFGVGQILLFVDGGALTPQDLAQLAYNEISPPALGTGTAPPSGKDGLVGLPEWIWVDAADYKTLTATVALGGLSATVTATPGPLTINPGDGQGTISCPGPGTPYNAAEPASSQHSACTILYSQPSTSAPGGEFTVTIQVTWSAKWTGTGGTGGTLNPITRTTTIALPIAQAETVFSGGGA